MENNYNEFLVVPGFSDSKTAVGEKGLDMLNWLKKRNELIELGCLGLSHLLPFCSGLPKSSFGSRWINNFRFLRL